MTPEPPKETPWEPSLDDPVIKEYIRDRVGEDGLAVAQLIGEREPVQGVDILETIQDKPSNVRKVLYKLEDFRIAEYQKDTDKTGWETFYWRLTLHEVKHQINKERRKLLQQFEDQLKLERENSFYICPEGHLRTAFEEALKIEFRCPECNKPMSVIENDERVRTLETTIADLRDRVTD